MSTISCKRSASCDPGQHIDVSSVHKFFDLRWLMFSRDKSGSGVRQRGRAGHDTFGNSFYMEQVDASPVGQLRDLRRQQIDELEKDIHKQEALNKDLAGTDVGSKGSRTALMVLSILVVIGIFLVITYLTQAEYADELRQAPPVKVAPADNVVGGPQAGRAVPAAQL